MAHISPNARLDKTYRRNAHLAMLAFSFENPQPSETLTISDGESFKIENVSTSVSALFAYLHEYSENPSAYGDVSGHIESLSATEGRMLLDILKQFVNKKSFVLYTSEGNGEVDVSRSTIYSKREVSVSAVLKCLIIVDLFLCILVYHNKSHHSTSYHLQNHLPY